MRAKVWLEKDGKPVIGKGRAQLLQEIEKTGSIRDAASKLGLSYRYAWGMVAKMGKASGHPVVVSTRGGRRGGASKLSNHGRELLDVYLRADAMKMAGGFASLGDEIRCKVISVDESKNIVVMRSPSDRGDIIVTVRGGDLPNKVTVGDDLTLLRQ